MVGALDRLRIKQSPKSVKRVAIFSVHTSPMEQPGSKDAGGMNVYIRNLAMELAAQGISVDVFTRATVAHQDRKPDSLPGVAVKNVLPKSLIQIPKEEFPTHLDTLTRQLEEMMVKNSPAEGYDIIHSHYWLNGLLALRISEKWAVPFIHTMHTLGKVKNMHLAEGDVREPEERLSGEEEIVRSGPMLIANTEIERQELIDLYGADPSAITVIEPGVNLNVFTNVGRAESRRYIGIPPHLNHVVFAGRIQKLKAPDVLLDAIALLHRQQPQLPLRVSVIGAQSGSVSLDLSSQISRLGLEKIVRLHSPVSAPDLAHWFRSADAVAVPSFSESFGMVALEAQACGTPVIAANVGGLKSAVQDNKTGLLVPSHDPKDWADQLAYLLNNPKRRKRYENAAAKYASGFGWPRTASQTIAAYRAGVKNFKYPRS